MTPVVFEGVSGRRYEATLRPRAIGFSGHAGIGIEFLFEGAWHRYAAQWPAGMPRPGGVMALFSEWIARLVGEPVKEIKETR